MVISNKFFKETLPFTAGTSTLYATLYKEGDKIPKAVLLYFHGGGLLYGNRHDLPLYHIEKLCSEGYAILAFDYHLAPATKLPHILDDVHTAIEWYISKRLSLFNSKCPYFLWGRSAGAYLCLLSALRDFTEKPRGIISYYGYAFLCNHWFNTPNKYYLQFPTVDIKESSCILNEICTYGDLNQRYSLYVHARQMGNWISFFYEGREKHFYEPYSFRLISSFKDYPPTFLVHGINDPDVPFEESKELDKILPDTRTFFVSESIHDFDRNTDSYSTEALLNNTLDFLHSLTNP